MSNLFDEADNFVEGEFEHSQEKVEIGVSEGSMLDARRRLENLLEEKRLRNELDDDFDDY